TPRSRPPVPLAAPPAVPAAPPAVPAVPVPAAKAAAPARLTAAPVRRRPRSRTPPPAVTKRPDVSSRLVVGAVPGRLGLRHARPPVGAIRQREHGQHTAELRVAGEVPVCADGAETLGRALEPGRHPEPGPAADAGQHADVLAAFVHAGVDVADGP